MSVGLDVGTSFLVLAKQTDSGVSYKQMRDAFYRMKPASPIASKMMEKGLAGLSYFKDNDGSYVIVGQDAINKAIERHQSALRPMFRGVLSPREPDARRVLKFLLTELVGRPEVEGETLVYSIPAEPVDFGDEEFNTGYHEDVLKKDLGELGWSVIALNEAEAICYSELEDSDYTGISISMGSGMANICLMSAGEVILKFSIARSGDFIDRMAAISTNQPDSVIQVEKENTNFVIGEDSPNPIISAVSSYYIRLIDYVIRHLVVRLSKSEDIPVFTKPIPVIVAGGTSKAGGFVDVFRKKLSENNCPIAISEVRHAKEPLYAVSKGCLLASSFIE